jgi:hypothetical protein
MVKDFSEVFSHEEDIKISLKISFNILLDDILSSKDENDEAFSDCIQRDFRSAELLQIPEHAK